MTSKQETVSEEDILTNGSSDTTEVRKVKFAEKARVSGGTRDEKDASIPTKQDGQGDRSISAETYSDASSATSEADSGPYEVIEYDPSEQVDSLMPPLDNEYEGEEDFMGFEPEIEANTPAAEALRASAAVKVSRVGKAARAVNMQAVRKLVKRATGTSKQGLVRGKPPRLPPQQNLEGVDEEETDNAGDGEHITEAHVHQRPSPQRHTSVITPDDHKRAMPDDVVAGTVEAGKKVLGAVDPHDMLKAVRWRKKKKGQTNKPKSYAKGKVIDGEHELYTLSIAVMIGVRTSISKTNIVINSGPSKRWVLPQDYKTSEKYEFRPKGGTGMPSHQLAHTFKFKDYAPVVFAYLRRMSGINEFDFLISVCGNANFIEFISNAKSGQFFFYSSDGRYMIKTMTNAECRFLRRILPDYFKHCSENPNTMITRFFGMYRVKLYHLRRNVKFVIMNSVYYTDKYLQSFYDLKGSVIGRDAKPHHAVKKDNDLRKALPDGALVLCSDTRRKVREQLEKDTEFLRRMGIMDYSMLVGIHHIPPAKDQSIAKTGFRTSTRKVHRRVVTDTDLQQLTDSESSRRLLMTPSGRAIDDSKLSSRRFDDDLFAFEDGLDDDESSYLKGSNRRGSEERKSMNEETEQKKQATVEKLYWPFDHLFDIHGHRRMKKPCSKEAESTPSQHESLHGFNILKFEPPLSDRKDGGFEMDTTGLSLPLIYKGDDGSNKLYEGKIFYMGIIDILQEYNSRKVVEAHYRLLQSGKSDASCVDPRTYGRRFLEFFDEYTVRDHAMAGIEMTLDIHESRSSEKPDLVIASPTDIKERSDSAGMDGAVEELSTPTAHNAPEEWPNAAKAGKMKKSPPSDGKTKAARRLFLGRGNNAE